MTTRVERAVVGAEGSAQRSAGEMRLDRLRAPFPLRCGALLIDYAVMMSIVAFTTLVARSFGGGGARMAGDTIEAIGYLTAAVVTMLNLIVLAGLRGQTLGKWATGLRIERRDATPLGFRRALARHLIGYPLSLVIFGIGFLIAAFNDRQRALHDMIADTVVVRISGGGVDRRHSVAQ